MTGSDAARFLEWVCDNVVARGPSSVTYTQALNSSGGIEADFTVTQLEDQAFRIITGTACGNRDLGWLGWELYCSTEYGAALWRTLWEAGQPHGLIAAGYRAIDSMRLEKGYRVWGAGIGPETTPYEAGLG